MSTNNENVPFSLPLRPDPIHKALARDADDKVAFQMYCLPDVRDYVIAAVNSHEELKRQRDDAQQQAIENDKSAGAWMNRVETAEQQKEELLKALEESEEIIYHLLNVAENDLAEDHFTKYKSFMQKINAVIAKKYKRGDQHSL